MPSTRFLDNQAASLYAFSTMFTIKMISLENGYCTYRVFA